MLSVLQAVQLLRRKQKLRAPLRKLLAIAHEAIQRQQQTNYKLYIHIINPILAIFNLQKVMGGTKVL